MKQEQDKWEKLIHLTETYEPNADLAENVIQKINQKESTVKFKKPISWQVSIAVCFLICCIGLAIFLPVYLSGRTPVNMYFSEDSLEIVDVTDVEAFARDNRLSIQYYSYATVKTRCAKIKEEDEWAYLVQDMIYIGETGFDTINLKVVLIQNTTFDFYIDFNSLPLITDVTDIPIEYAVTEKDDENECKAKFSYEGSTYYLEIKTTDGGTAAIQKYVNLLIN